LPEQKRAPRAFFAPNDGLKMRIFGIARKCFAIALAENLNLSCAGANSGAQKIVFGPLTGREKRTARITGADVNK
jgi:hypothetical protein